LDDVNYEGYPNIKDAETRAGREENEITAVKVLDHPVHNPDVAPSDFQLFLHL
jgi:hypothetical protein